MRAAPVIATPEGTSTMAVEAWGNLAEDAPGELVDGRLTEVEVPDVTHETVLGALFLQVMAWARPRGVQVLLSGVKYALADDRGRMPDLSVFLPGREPPPHGVVRIPPDIAIEVVSPAPSDARRDRIEKPSDYAAFGVRWYWIVDPGLRTFEVWELRDGAYAHVGAASTGPVREIPGCEGLELDLDEVWPPGSA